MRIILGITADQHINSTVGLCPPRVELDDGGTYTPPRHIRELWDYWLDFCRKLESAAQPGDEIIKIFNGDLVDADLHGRTHQVITRNTSRILEIGADVIAPALKKAKTALFIRGTAAHTGKCAELEEGIACDCTIAKRRTDKIASWYHIQMDAGGVKLDIMHHGKMGRLPWTSLNPLATLAAELQLRQWTPHLAIRAHHHRWGDTGDNYPVRVIATAGWQLPTDYSYRNGGILGDIGGLIIRIEDNGKYSVEKVKYPLPQSQRIWRLR